MKILAIIPARGGSKSVPRKNITEIGGKPLIALTIEEALKSNKVDEIVVTTDDEEIADIARRFGASVPFMRPKELAADTAETAPTVLHCLGEMETCKNVEYDAVLLLQPTTPFRKIQHIDEAIMMMENETCDSVVSVVSVGANHPFRMKRMVGKRLINYLDQGFEDMRPRQSLPPVYIRNGAIYLTSRKTLVEMGTLVGPHCLGFEMSAEDSINIDDPLDLQLARLYMDGRKI